MCEKNDISYIKPNLYRPKYASKIYLNENCYKQSKINITLITLFLMLNKGK